jgi:ectoine hydroxylase-related dioxygenase (phytanoyl-CoA dioxygenase family)
MMPASIEEALAAAGVTDAMLTPEEIAAFDNDGYVVLRGALAPMVDALRERFEAQVLAPDKWPAPREADWRHAMLDNDAITQRACLSPRLLAGCFHMFKQRFFLATIQGREPKHNGGRQMLHRDWPAEAGSPGLVVGLGFLDDFGPANGATRVVPGTHRDIGGLNDYSHFTTHPDERVVEGGAGDVLLFYGQLAHSGMRNQGGAPRRTLQICYRNYAVHAEFPDKRDLSGAPPLDRYLMGAS